MFKNQSLPTLRLTVQGGIMNHPILEIVRQSECPKLSWLLKPGERVRYYKFVEPRKGSGWHEQWVPISAAEAYEIAERYDKEKP